MTRVIMFIAIMAITTHISFGQKTLLEDVKTITLKRGEKTTGRRSTPVEQMVCVGGGGCHDRQPTTAQCRNKGTDGNDMQWECLAELDPKYRFGKIEVICEGYEYPQDPYILIGSCGLEYTIEYTSNVRSYRKDSLGGVNLLIFVCMIIMLCCKCPSSGRTSSFAGGAAVGMAANSYYRRGGSGYRGMSSGFGGTRMSSGFGGTRRR